MPTVAELDAAEKRVKAQLKAVRQAKKGRVKPPNACESQSDIGRAYGVSQSAAYKWTNLPGFPPKNADGWWLKEEIDAFLQAEGLGPYREASSDRSDARLEKIREETEKIRLEKRALERAEQLDLGGILLADDVAGMHERLVYTHSAVLDSLIDRVDRELPRELSAELRGRCLEVFRRISVDLRAVMEELTAGDGDEDGTEETATD